MKPAQNFLTSSSGKSGEKHFTSFINWFVVTATEEINVSDSMKSHLRRVQFTNGFLPLQKIQDEYLYLFDRHIEHDLQGFLIEHSRKLFGHRCKPVVHDPRCRGMVQEKCLQEAATENMGACLFKNRFANLCFLRTVHGRSFPSCEVVVLGIRPVALFFWTILDPCCVQLPYACTQFFQAIIQFSHFIWVARISFLKITNYI